MSAIAALKGYRTQFLYSLFYIISNAESNYKFKLEGIEDLDIYDEKNNLIEIIQIKNLKSTLVLSDIFQKTKTSFLKRYLAAKGNFPNVIPKLISYGNIGNQVKNWDDSNISPEEKKYLIRTEDWKAIKQNMQLIEVNENDTFSEIIKLLKQKFISIDPLPTIEILLYWLYSIAEKQEIITYQDLYNKIEIIAQYLSERIAVSAQYGVYFSPLKNPTKDNINLDLLREEFYLGVNARYEHIIYGLDIIRPDLLSIIHAFFNESNIILIQGASGQGKSTLSYRYVFENSSSFLSYELNIQENPELTRQSIIAIESMAKSLNIPILMLIDVKPNSTEWLKIVREFSYNNKLKFLITIRQEDFYKANASNISFLYKQIELEFNREEAELIYDNLNKEKKDYKHADFEEAWTKFGEKGPLLEFVYMITQGTSLQNKLQHQISIIEKESRIENHPELLTLLKLISLADANGSRIEVSKIEKRVNLLTALKRLEKEYLIKITEDKKYIIGLHPLRSKLLVKYLYDDFLNEFEKSVIECLYIITDKDMYSFILHILYQNYIRPDELVHKLKDFTNISWTFYSAMFKGLLWAGIRKYINDNLPVLDKGYEYYKDSWTFFVDVLFTNEDPLKLLEPLHDLIPKEKIEFAKTLNKDLPSKDCYFNYVNLLLTEVTFPVREPQSSEDWNSLGTLMFWVSQYPIVQISCDNISYYNFEEAFKKCDIYELSTLMMGMEYYDDKIRQKKENINILFAKKFRDEFKIPELIITQTEVKAGFIYDILNTEKHIPVHDRALEIIRLLRRAFPMKKIYSTQGHGHRLQLLYPTHDDSHKEIPIKNLYIDELRNLNSMFINLYEYEKLPPDWENLHNEIAENEKNISNAIKKFNDCLNKYYQNFDYKELLFMVENYNYQKVKMLKIPKSISDYLGIYSNSDHNLQNISKNEVVSSQIQAVMDYKYRNFLKSYKDFIFPIENFISQSIEVIYSFLLEMLNQKNINEDRGLKKLSVANLYDGISRLIIYQAIKAKYFKKYFALYNEQIKLSDLYASAYLLINFLEGSKIKLMTNAGKMAENSIMQIKKDFEKILKKYFKNISTEEYEVSYVNNNSTNNLPLIFIKTVDPVHYIVILNKVYGFLKDIIESSASLNLRQLMTKIYFENFYVIPIVNNFSVNLSWYEFPLWVLNDKDRKFEELNPLLYIKPIEKTVIANFELSNWTQFSDDIDNATNFIAHYSTFVALIQHLYDLKYFYEIDVDSIGHEIFEKHIKKYNQEIQNSLQGLFDFITKIISQFQFNKDLYMYDEYEKLYWDLLTNIKNFILIESINEGGLIKLNIKLKDLICWVEKLNENSQYIYQLYIIICRRSILSKI